MTSCDIVSEFILEGEKCYGFATEKRHALGMKITYFAAKGHH